MRSPRCVEAGQPQQVAGTRWVALRSVLEDVAHVCPILTDVFNHWFAQGAIPGCVTKGVITLLKKGGQHVGEGLDNYRLIKILARVLANRLQRVISDLIGPEQILL